MIFLNKCSGLIDDVISNLEKKLITFEKTIMFKKQGRHGGDTTSLPPMEPGSILAWCHTCIWVEFVVSSFFALRVFL